MSKSDASADRVAAILTAAEETAERVRAEAEGRMRARISEGDRAAENRVRAAEDEALEILAQAGAEAERLRAEARTQAESRALQIIARAEEQAATRTAEAEQQAVKRAAEAEARARELLRDARAVAGAVKVEGTQLTDHIRELSQSLSNNANRLLRDVLDAHAALGAALDRSDGGVPRSSGPSVRALGAPPDTDFDVPEFAPRRR